MSEEKLIQAKEALQRGDFESVINLLKPMLAQMPDNMEIRSILTEAQEGMMLRLQLTQKVKQANDLLQSGDRVGAQKAVESILKIDPGNPDALNLKRLLQIPADENVNATVAFDFNDQLGVEEAQESPLTVDSGNQNSGLETLEPFELYFDTQESKTKESAQKIEEQPLESFDWEGASPTGNSAVQDFPMDSLEGGGVPSAGDELVHPFPMDTLEGAQGQGEETHLSSSQDMPFSLGGEENKVENFITEGKKLISAGRYQDAIDVLTRVFILDEENKDAQVLIDQAKEKLQGLEQKVNLILNEAISAYDAQDYEKAKELFNKVLELFPGHREADFYLKEIEEKSQNVGFQLEQPTGESAGFKFEEQDSFTFEPSGATEDLSSLVGGAKQEVEQVPAPPEPIVAPKPTIEQQTTKAAKPKKEGKQIPIGMIAGIVIALILVGGSFFVVPILWNKIFTPKPTAMKIPPSPPPKKTETKQQETSPKPQQPPQQQRTLSDILLEANSAMQAKQYEKAVNLYTEAESLSKSDLEIKSKLEAAKIALVKQQEEEARIQRFVSDYEKAVKYFKMSEYGEAVRISWRLIYPKEQEAFAVQMGKADAIKKIIRNGYFNWAIKDLKAGSPLVAKKNLQDLLDFAPRDSKARELFAFADKYTKNQIDEDYRQKVQDLSYRSIDE
ncbi:MAG: tetratricopeptide repeat protein [Thermoanaerobaculaceae bacterium]|nr:tetratricopeptide repeat protein [Thermoanaerobaculaceae bacterium]